MKTRLLSLFVFCGLVFSFNDLFAVVVPIISYSPSVFNLTTNVSAGTNTPVNTGGAVTTWAINPALPTGLAFSTVTGVINGTPTVAAAGATYTITATNASGSGTTTIRLSVGLVNNWTGATSTAWALAGNWSGGIPAATDNVQIGVVTYSTRQPALIAATSVNSITFGPNTGTTLAIPTLTITGAAVTLTVSNALTVNEIGTTANPTLTGTGNVNIAPGATLNVNAGKILYTTLTGALTLKSDATGSAAVGQIATTSIAGSGASAIKVERFITGGVGHRSYYLMSSPVFATTVASNNIYDLHYLVAPTAGMYLTGGSGGSANGFDKLGNPSLYLYREDQVPTNASFTGGNFSGITSFNNTNVYDYFVNGGATVFNIPVGNGYLMFFRGNRSGGTLAQETLTSFTTAPTVTLIASGTLNAGQVTVHNWYTPASANIGFTTTSGTPSIEGFNLVGNPYASSIDWETFNTTTSTTGIFGSSVANTVYELNPLTKNYDTYQVGGGSTNNGTRLIVSGQGFFVQASVNTAQLIFNESAKAVVQHTGAVLFMASKESLNTAKNNTPKQFLKLQLSKDSINKDDIYIGFSASAKSQYVFNEDALYNHGAGQVSLASMSSDSLALAINKLPPPTLKSDTVLLKVGAISSGAYSLNMLDLSSLPAIYDVWLRDSYVKDSLDMRQNKTYAFNIDLSQAATYGTGRFSLIIRQNKARHVHLLDFTAHKVITGVEVRWKTENEKSYTIFTVERSTDNGTTFGAIGGFTSSDQDTYSLVDKNPFIGQNQYRLKIENLNGTITYSKVVLVNYTTPATSTLTNNISVYPNPVINKMTLIITSPGLSANLNELSGLIGSKLKTETTKADEYSITIVNNSGIVVKKGESNQPIWQTELGNLMPGSYIVQVTSKNGKGIIGQCVFVKL